jgi:hypothetical protein
MAMAKIVVDRAFVAQRAHWCCEYCKSQERFAPQAFTIDHIIPISKNGSDDTDNLAYACQGCNMYKASRVETFDIVSNQMVPIFNPRIQNWHDHFAWSHDFTELIALSSSGRVTIVGLKLNRKILIKLRRFLYLHGEHPPI